MLVEVCMKSDEQRFTVGRWWATSPDFVIDTLNRQLKAAAAIWPGLSVYEISDGEPTPTQGGEDNSHMGRDQNG
jgi:hypothetical protein